MLTYMHQRQLMYSVSTPTRSRPTAPPAAAMAPKMPNALALLGLGERHGEQGQCGGGEQSAEDALEGAGGEEHAEVDGGAAERGGQGEADQADHEGALAAPQVTDPSAQQQQTAESEAVGGDHPLPVAVGDVQIRLGVRQRDVHDRRVQHDHQLGYRDDRQRLPAPRIDRRRTGGSVTCRHGEWLGFCDGWNEGKRRTPQSGNHAVGRAGKALFHTRPACGSTATCGRAGRALEPRSVLWQGTPRAFRPGRGIPTL
jgi:hypothetical protein